MPVTYASTDVGILALKPARANQTADPVRMRDALNPH
jgi:hypothetical protein